MGSGVVIYYIFRRPWAVDILFITNTSTSAILHLLFTKETKGGISNAMRILCRTTALATGLLLLLGNAVQPTLCFGHGSNSGHQRIYFQTWVVGEVREPPPRCLLTTPCYFCILHSAARLCVLYVTCSTAPSSC